MVEVSTMRQMYLIYLLLWCEVIGLLACPSSIDFNFFSDFLHAHGQNSLIVYLNEGIYIGDLSSTLTSSLQRFQVVKNHSNVTAQSKDLNVIPCASPANNHLQKLIQLGIEPGSYWLVNVEEGNLDSIKSTKGLGLNDNLYLYQRIGQSIKVLEAYKIHHDFPAEITEINEWNRGSGFNRPFGSMFDRRSNLRGIELKITTLEAAPYTTSITQDSHGKYLLKGMLPDIMFVLMDVLNFTVKFVPTLDGQWGALQQDGTWSGMINLLQSGQVDFAPTDFTVTEERSKAVDFLIPITQYFHAVFIKNPVNNLNFYAYTETFTANAWFAVAIFLTVIPLLVYATVRREKSYNETLEFTFGALVTQFRQEMPDSLTGNVSFTVILIAGYLIYALWEAMLISYLATRVIALPFRNLEGLLKESSYRLGLMPGSAYEDAFKLSNDPVWIEIYNSRVQPYLEDYQSYGSAVEPLALENEETAIYNNYFISITTEAFINCELIVVPGKYDFKPLAMAVQKDSPYLELFNHYLKLLFEQGVIDQIMSIYEPPAQACPDYSGRPLGLESCFSAFLMLGSLALACILILLPFEILLKRKLGKSDNPNTGKGTKLTRNVLKKF